MSPISVHNLYASNFETLIIKVLILYPKHDKHDHLNTFKILPTNLHWNTIYSCQNNNAVKEKCVTISGEGTGEDSLEELGEFKSDEFSPACFTETVTWEKIMNSI